MTIDEAGTVGRYMHRALEVVPEDAVIVDVAERMASRAIGSVLVESAVPKVGPRIVGIVTERDVIWRVLAKEGDPAEMTTADVMVAPLLTIAPDRPMMEACHLMEAKRLRHLCVLEGGEIVGLISVRDLVRRFIDQEQGPVHDLEDVYHPLSVLMQKTMIMTDSEGTVLSAAQQMAEKQVGALLVTEADELVGIVTESDLVRKVVARSGKPRTVRVRSVMSSPLIKIDINRTVRDASGRMASHGVRHLAVLDQHKVVGILSVRDLVRMVSVRDRPRFLRQKEWRARQTDTSTGAGSHRVPPDLRQWRNTSRCAGTCFGDPMVGEGGSFT
jgi:CBS domain-containing protein